ncbi:MAG: ROK family transcriptional regulator [Myxococcota bacterium]
MMLPQSRKLGETNGVSANADVLPPGAVRAQHYAVLLRLLWAHRELSRAELARRTGLSRSTVSAIVNDILASGIVRETRAGSSSGGRRPIMLGFNDDARIILGLDIGATHVGALTMNLRGKILTRRSYSMNTRSHPKETLALIADLGREVLREVPSADLLGVGAGVPAPLHPKTKRLLRTVMPQWHDIDVAEALQDLFSCPVRLDNDANLGALAEQWWGAGKAGEDLVFVKVATGIGAGLIIGGHIVHGAHGVAGELGHLSVDPNGPPCSCGVNGCLNVIIGTSALLARAEARRPHFPDSMLHGAPVTLVQLIEAVHQQDPLAMEIIRFAGERLGAGLANLLNVLDPSIVVLGGQITQVGEPLLKTVRQTVLRRTLVTSLGEERVVRSQIDEQSVALGAATLILRAALETQEIPLAASTENA